MRIPIVAMQLALIDKWNILVSSFHKIMFKFCVYHKNH